MYVRLRKVTRDVSYYQQINYPVEIYPMPDGIFCAEIRTIPVPTVHLEIPLDEFEQLANQTPIGQFVVS